MGFLSQKKDDKRRKEEQKGKQPAKKWWGKLTGKDGPESQSSVRFELPAESTTERSTAISNSRAPRQSRAQRHEPTASPALSRASSLSETDAQYLATQARTGTQHPSLNSGFNADAFAGAFEPAYQTPPVQDRGGQSGLAPRQREQPTASPSLSRASSLSEEDAQFLATRPGRPRPEFDRDAFAGAFEPERQRHRPQTKYPVPPLTKQQLDALAGAYAPPAPPPRRMDKLDYR